ncbi:MAG TPA: hypothetical protein VD706_01560 [Candidatus Saccharimonadales bacterium]|nr:hypothetical protein [Candidatus Saccharimonadales bacterium]
MTKNHHLKILQYVIGSAIIIEGADKFFNLLVDWKIYAAPEILELWPFSTGQFLITLGISEIIIGVILILSVRLGGMLVAGLMAGITLNLLLLGNFYNMILLNIIIGLTSLFLHPMSLPDNSSDEQAL